VQQVNDITKEVYEALFTMLAGITVHDINIPVISVTGGLNEYGTYISISQCAQLPDSNKTGVGYSISVLVEVSHKGADYLFVSDIVNEIIGRLYEQSEIPVNDKIAYIVNEPEISEIVEDLGSDVYIRKLLRITMLITNTIAHV